MAKYLYNLLDIKFGTCDINNISNKKKEEMIAVFLSHSCRSLSFSNVVDVALLNCYLTYFDYKSELFCS